MKAVGVRISSSVVSRQVDGAIIAMSLETGQYTVMTDVSARIWALASPAASIERICEALRAEFDTTDEACREEVLGFLAELVEAGLLDEVSNEA